MADKLTPQQALAVGDRGGKLLVSAAAGSGKTKVLVDRLLSYLCDPVDPANLDDFLIITYTKAAASELRGKIAAKLTEQIAENPQNRHLQKQMQRLYLTHISTVHGLCGDLLREYAYRLDLAADFRVGDEAECQQMREEIITDLLERAYAHPDENPDFLTFLDSQGFGRNDSMVSYVLQRVYDSSRCHCDPEAWLQGCEAASKMSGLQDASETVWGQYLIADLMETMDCHISVIAECAKALNASENMEKPAAHFQGLLTQLQQLRESDSWDQVVQRIRIDFGRLVFPRKNVDEDLIVQAKAAREACKKALEQKQKAFSDDSAQVLKDLSQTEASVRGLIALVRQFGKDYQSAKKSRRILDFSDLEQKTLDLLLGRSRSAPTAAAQEIGRRYREVLVDEYQDSNAVQDAIFDALTREKQNCFLVGDVKQSIYQFRLADPRIFLEKYRQYLPAGEAPERQGRKVLLSHNFRSGGEIVEAVNHVFSTCMRPSVGGLCYGEAEALREGIPHEKLPDEAVELYIMDTDTDTYSREAAFVAERIQQMLEEKTLVRDGSSFRPVKPEDIVILLRSPGSAGGEFQRALAARGIRCASGGGTDLLKTEEVSSFRAFLQTIANPRLDIPLIATLVSPIFGFTAQDLAEIRSREKKSTFFEALMVNPAEKTQYFLDVLDALREEARRERLTVLLERCMTLTRLDSIFSAMNDGQTRWNNLQSFYHLAVEYEAAGNGGLQQFLEYLTVLEARGIPANSSGNSGCVTVMSIHKSKGLEYPVVFLCNLSRSFNREDLRAPILCDKELGLGLSVADNRSRIRYPNIAKRAIAVKMGAQSTSEEMRILYVAMTRARDRLVMTCAPKSLDKKLQDIAARFDFDGGELLCRGASCLGDWILLASMRRMEAGSLHARGNRPRELLMLDYPWRIQTTEPVEESQPSVILPEFESSLPTDAVNRIGRSLSFRYPHMEATQTPSKQTATGQKGRFKDEEAAEKTLPAYSNRTWRKPAFRDPESSGAAYGSALHAAMQYLRYDHCGSTGAVREEIKRLVDQGFLTREQGVLVPCEKIANFFASSIGKRLRDGTPFLREFKFSIFDSGENYGDGLEGEQVLLQGVVDCALLEEDGITIIDFKSDHVSEETLPVVSQRYKTQVEIYAQALSRIYEMPIKAKYLYFFKLNRFVEVMD